MHRQHNTPYALHQYICTTSIHMHHVNTDAAYEYKSIIITSMTTHTQHNNTYELHAYIMHHINTNTPMPICSTRRSVLQCVAVCCSVLQCVAVCCSVLQQKHIRRYAVRGRGGSKAPHIRHCSVLHCVAVCCSVLQCIAVEYTYADVQYEEEAGRKLKIYAIAVCYSVLQCVAVCCSVL